MDRDTLTAYALGTLGEAEAREVERYLRDHPEAEREVQAELEALAQLVLDLDPAPVPEGSEDRLIARVRADIQKAEIQEAPTPLPTRPRPPARRRSPALGWALGLAAAVTLLAVLGTPALRDWQSARQFSAYQATPGAVTRNLPGAGGVSLGTLVRLPDGRTFVQLRDEPVQGRVYQAWRVEASGPVSLGVFGGRNFAVAALPPGATFALSVEPPGGSAAPSSTPITVVRL